MEINESLVALNVKAPDAQATIELLAGMLHSEGFVSAEYGHQTYIREQQHPTGLPTKPFCIAFPHADAEGVYQSALAVARLYQPVVFRNMGDPEEDLDVHLVFMLANRNPEEQVQTLRNLALIFSQPEKLIKLRDQTTTAEVVAWLCRELCKDEDNGRRADSQKGG